LEQTKEHRTDKCLSTREGQFHGCYDDHDQKRPEHEPQARSPKWRVGESYVNEIRNVPLSRATNEWMRLVL
jgi:hypothetical protein